MQHSKKNPSKAKRIFSKRALSTQEYRPEQEINEALAEIPSMDIDKSNTFSNITQISSECPICDCSTFKTQRVILDCGHACCSNCFKCWSQSSNNCPFCFRESKRVTHFLSGNKRSALLKITSTQPGCQVCKKRQNVHVMEYCGRCNVRRVHSYCHPALDSKEGPNWLCSECKRGASRRRRNARDYQQVEEVDEMGEQILQRPKRSTRENKRKGV